MVDATPIIHRLEADTWLGYNLHAVSHKLPLGGPRATVKKQARPPAVELLEAAAHRERMRQNWLLVLRSPSHLAPHCCFLLGASGLVVM